MGLGGGGVGVECEGVRGEIVVVVELGILGWLAHVGVGVRLQIVRVNVWVFESSSVGLKGNSGWVVGEVL